MVRMPSKRNSNSPFKLRSSRTVWSSPWFSIRQDEVTLPNGLPNAFNTVNHPGAVWVIPVTHEGEIVLIHQYRQSVEDWCWELPAGGKDVYKSPGHKEDWFKGIKTGAKTIMNIEAAAGVANLCVLGNLSYILGRKLEWDQAKQTIVGDQQAQRMMSRPQRPPYHL